MKRSVIIVTSTCIALFMGLLSGLSGSHATSYPAIDRNDRESVRNAYLNWFLRTQSVPLGWTGDISKCRTDKPLAQPLAAVGTISTAARQANVDETNYFRGMAGLQPVTESNAASAKAQQAALIMHAQRALSHDPPDTWKCFSAYGLDGAKRSNLGLGWPGSNGFVGGVGGYMDDGGAGNTAVGHRRWMLYPPLSQIGVGATPGSSAMTVLGPDIARNNPAKPEGVAWPSAGFFPFENLPGSQSERWSYSINGNNFANATVSVKKNGSPILTRIVHRSGGGFGDGAIVWEMPQVAEPAGENVDDYQVTIAGATTQPIVYTVKVFRAARLTAGQIAIEGAAKVGNTLKAKPTGWPADATLHYTWQVNGEYANPSGTNVDEFPLDGIYAGSKISVRVTASKPYFRSAQSTSSQTATVAKGQFAIAKPRITGKINLYEPLEAHVNIPQDVWDVEYQWFRNGKAVRYENGTSYWLSDEDAGKRLRVRVTVKATGYEDSVISSDEVQLPAKLVEAAKPKPKPKKKFKVTAKPRIVGKARVGRVLRATKGTWNSKPTRTKFQWLRKGRAIRGATKIRYRLKRADRRTRISVRVTVSRSGYTTRKVVSTKTKRIAARK